MTVAKRIAAQTPNLNVEVPLMVKESEAARYLGVSVSYLRKARCDGVLRHQTPAPPFVKIGGSVFYRRADIDEWVGRLTPQQVIGDTAHEG